MDHSVESPRKKSSKNHSIEETIDGLNDIIMKARQRENHEDVLYCEEIAQVKEILAADSYIETDVVYMQVLSLCLDKHRRRAFLDLKSMEGRLNWMKVSWDFAHRNSK